MGGPRARKGTQPRTGHKVIAQTPQPVLFSRKLGPCLRLLPGCLAHDRRCQFVELQSRTNPHSPAASSQGRHHNPTVTLMFTTSLSPQVWRPGPPPPTPAFTQLTPSAPSVESCGGPAFSCHTVPVTESHARPLSPAPTTGPAGSLHHRAPGCRTPLSGPLALSPPSALGTQTSLWGANLLLTPLSPKQAHPLSLPKPSSWT